MSNSNSTARHQQIDQSRLPATQTESNPAVKRLNIHSFKSLIGRQHPDTTSYNSYSCDSARVFGLVLALYSGTSPPHLDRTLISNSTTSLSVSTPRPGLQSRQLILIRRSPITIPIQLPTVAVESPPSARICFLVAGPTLQH